MKRPARLYIVMPCYNEEAIIQKTIQEVSAKMNYLRNIELIDNESAMLFVDDGSIDNTWNIIISQAEINNKVKGIKLASNAGHQNALMAGLLTAKDYADVVISMDADLQHDINALERFMELYHNGFDLVFGIRKDRQTDSFLKKVTAISFYKFMSGLDIKVIKNHADFRLMTCQVLEALSQYSEVNLFLRGIVLTLGFKQTTLFFEVKDRMAGSSKYTISKMFRLALDGITSFSIKPLRVITLTGIIVFFISIIMIAWNITDYFRGTAVAGWASLSCSIWLLGGLIILCIGIVGEYMGKIYNEVKHRPRYIIENQIL